jgi:hypothetical protein
MAEMDNPLSSEEIERIRKRAEAAQPGPWKSFIEGRDHTSGSSFIKIGQGKNRGDDIEIYGASTPDQDFIASARQDIPRLLEEIENLKRQLANRK